MPDRSALGSDPSLLRRINTSAVLRMLYGSPALTLAGVVQQTGLSRRTAEAVLEDLIKARLVEDLPARTRGVGRPARTFRFRPGSACVAAAVVGTRSVNVVVADLVGEVLASGTRAVSRTSRRAGRIRAMTTALDDALESAGLDLDRLRALTVATPSVVLPGGIVDRCEVLPDWSDFSLQDALAPTLDCPIYVENDVNLAAIGEHWRGSGRGAQDMVWVLIGRRARVGTLIDGRLYRGADGAAGEIGWVSALGWSRVRDHQLSMLNAGTPRLRADGLTVIRDALAGDPKAIAVVDSFGETLSHGLSAVILALNPGRLILGGAGAFGGDILVTAVRRHLEPVCLKVPDIRLSSLGEDAVSHGALRVSLDHVEQQLFAVT